MHLASSGYTPFGGETKQETYSNITQCILDFPEDLFAGISESAIEFICSLLKKKPRDRLSSSKCLEHEWLSDLDESNRPMQPTDEPTNDCVNGKGIAENGNLPQTNGKCFNHNTVDQETASLRSPIDLSINLPLSPEPLIKSIEPINTGQQQLPVQTESPQTVPGPVCDQSGQIETDTTTDLNSPASAEQVSAVDVNSTSSLPASQCAEPLEPPPSAPNRAVLDEIQPNKPIENDKLSPDSEHLKASSNQELLNAISTNSANELITTTCTNVTLLTAN